MKEFKIFVSRLAKKEMSDAEINEYLFLNKNKTIEYYGCVKCQKQHFKGEPLYEEHIAFQSKHGVQEMSLKRYLKINSVKKQA